jgi:hypothetical protein
VLRVNFCSKNSSNYPFLTELVINLDGCEFMELLHYEKPKYKFDLIEIDSKSNSLKEIYAALCIIQHGGVIGVNFSDIKHLRVKKKDQKTLYMYNNFKPT